jgi:replicative DNA helicase
VERRLPHDYELEQSLLGAILVDPSQFSAARKILGPADFVGDKTRRVFEAMDKCCLDGKPTEPVSVSRQIIEWDDEISKSIDQSFIESLYYITPHGIHAVHWAGIIKNYSLRRQLINAAGNMANKAYELRDGQDIQDVISAVMTDLVQLQAGTEVGHADWLSEVINRDFEKFHKVLSSSNVGGVSTQLPRLDNVMNGLEPQKLYLVAARPGMGKTALLLFLARACAEQGKRCFIVSLEQGKTALVQRMILSQARINRFKVRSSGAGLTEAQDMAFIDACSHLAQLPICVTDSVATVAEARLDLMGLQLRAGVDVLFFDYLDLAVDKSSEAGSEELRITNIAKQLKATAVKCNVPVISAGQLSRKVEERANKRPALSDLRYSGMLEAVSDVVMLLYRDDYYRERALAPPKDKAKPCTLEINVAKNKDGPSGQVNVYYDATTGLIGPLSDQEKLL